LACQAINRRKHRCHLLFDIGSSDCKTNRLVSLTETVQFSMICQGTRSVNVLANGHYMRFEDFVKGYQTNNLKSFVFFFSTFHSPMK